MKLPVPSRLTMAFAVGALVGADLPGQGNVPLVVTGEPETVKSEAGAVRATLLTEPVPGKVWPVAKPMMPLGPMRSPVSAGVAEPRP